MATESNTHTATQRAKNIKMVLFDVDGVLTDGTIWVVPTGPPARPEGDADAPHMAGHNSQGDGGFGLQSQSMAEMKGFSAHDGLGISIARVAGLKIGLITKRVSEALRVRARDLKIEYVYMGQSQKMKAVDDILHKTGLHPDELAYVGDDIIDLPPMRSVGLAVAVADARPQVIAEAHWVTPSAGGRGAGRDVIDFILDAQGLLNDSIERYIDDQKPVAAESDIGTGNM